MPLIKKTKGKLTSTVDELATAVVEARQSAGLTQEQLADKIKTARSFIVRLEKGRTSPTTKTLQRVAAATGHKLEIKFRRS